MASVNGDSDGGSDAGYEMYNLTASGSSGGATPDPQREESSLLIPWTGFSPDQPIDVDEEHFEHTRLLSTNPKGEDISPELDSESDNNSDDGTPGPGDQGTPGGATPVGGTPSGETSGGATPGGRIPDGGDPADPDSSGEANDSSDSNGDGNDSSDSNESITSYASDPEEEPTWTKDHCKEYCQPRWRAMRHIAHEHGERIRVLIRLLREERNISRRLKEALRTAQERVASLQGRHRSHTQVVRHHAHPPEK